MRTKVFVKICVNSFLNPLENRFDFPALFISDAVSSREPVSISLENAPKQKGRFSAPFFYVF
jgi:hypothetical protein